MMPHERVCIDLHDICIRVQGMHVTSQSCGYNKGTSSPNTYCIMHSAQLERTYWVW